MKYKIFLSAFFLFLIPGLSHAEYRVFLLKIAKRAAAAAPGPAADKRAPASTTPAPAQDFRLVESTLDPMQYRFYYQVSPEEEITYIDTWRCYGRTGDFQALCPNPKGQIPETTSPAP